jgi:hypothetical protein
LPLMKQQVTDLEQGITEVWASLYGAFVATTRTDTPYFLVKALQGYVAGVEGLRQSIAEVEQATKDFETLDYVQATDPKFVGRLEKLLGHHNLQPRINALQSALQDEVSRLQKRLTQSP